MKGIYVSNPADRKGGNHATADKLTDEAKHFWKVLQIDPALLKPRTLESFKENGVSAEIQRIRFEHYEDKRNQLIWQIDNAMKAASTRSPTHQLILTNSASKYSDVFPKPAMSTLSDKPTLPLRVPIDRDQIAQKHKAKSIYNEERVARVLEAKQKMAEDELKKADDKLKHELKRSKERDRLLKEEEKKKQDRLAKVELKRKQALDNKTRTVRELEKENHRKQKSMHQQYEKYLRDKEQRERSKVRTMYLQDSENRRSEFDKHGLLGDDTADQSKQIEERLRRADENKQNIIKERLQNNSFHLEKVEHK